MPKSAEVTYLAHRVGCMFCGRRDGVKTFEGVLDNEAVIEVRACKGCYDKLLIPRTPRPDWDEL